MGNDQIERSLHDGLDFYQDAARLTRDWAALAISLMEFARHISNSDPKWEKEQWILRPNNFVTFRIQFKRKNGLTLYLRGTEEEHLSLRGKTVRDSMAGYSKIILNNYSQAPEAFFAIKTAYDLFKRGRGRTKYTQTIR